MENKEKINAILNKLCGGVKRNLAKKAGVGDTTVACWLNRNTIDVIAIAEGFPEISLEWLVHGTGPMLKSEAESNEFELSEPAPTYNHVERMVTVPASVIADYRQQLENKDSQIATLLSILNK